LPLQNARVNIWQCDKGGSYSGYSTQVGNTTNTVGQTWLRGYQITDANGEVEFVTIFPGWYNGRICHIHFQVYVSSSYSAISQLTFNVADKQALYAANPTDYSKGADPTTLAGDNIFSDGYAYQVATLTPNSTNDGYDSYLEVTVRGNGTTGMGNIEKENAKQFLLGQNFPNPYVSETVIPVELVHPADVTLAFYDLQGRNVASVVKPNLAPGRHDVPIDLKALGLSAGNYACQIVVKNSDGIFQDFKMMTAAQ
jgi:hypothetical protein